MSILVLLDRRMRKGFIYIFSTCTDLHKHPLTMPNLNYIKGPALQNIVTRKRLFSLIYTQPQRFNAISTNVKDNEYVQPA